MPGRKPGIFTSRASLRNAASTAFSKSAAGMATFSRTLLPSSGSTLVVRGAIPGSEGYPGPVSAPRTGRRAGSRGDPRRVRRRCAAAGRRPGAAPRPRAVPDPCRSDRVRLPGPGLLRDERAPLRRRVTVRGAGTPRTRPAVPRRDLRVTRAPGRAVSPPARTAKLRVAALLQATSLTFRWLRRVWASSSRCSTTRPRRHSSPRACSRSSCSHRSHSRCSTTDRGRGRGDVVPWRARGVAQLGSAPALGAGGRGFKSPLPDRGRVPRAGVAQWQSLRFPI